MFLATSTRSRTAAPAGSRSNDAHVAAKVATTAPQGTRLATARATAHRRSRDGIAAMTTMVVPSLSNAW
jgi:hypothetical protein